MKIDTLICKLFYLKFLIKKNLVSERSSDSTRRHF